MLVDKWFFLNNGILILIYFYTVINAGNEINDLWNDKNMSLYFNFVFMIGYVISFFFNKYFIINKNYLNLLKYWSFILNILYFLFVIIIYINFNVIFKNFLLIFWLILIGFISYIYNEVAFGYANLYNFKIFKLTNIGIGLSNLMVALFLYLIRLIFKKYLFLILNILLFCWLIFYYIILFIYLNKNINSKKNKKIKSKLINNKKLVKVLKSNLDLIISILISNCFTYFLFPNLIEITKSVDKYYHKLLFLIFSLFDFISKLVTEKMIIKKVKFIFYLNFIRVLFVIVYLIIIRNYIIDTYFLKFILGFIIIVFILSNGYIINSCFYFNTVNNTKKDDKFASSKFIIFGLNLGIIYSNFSNIIIFQN